MGFDVFVTSDCGAVEDVFNKHHYVATGAEASAVSMKNGEDLSRLPKGFYIVGGRKIVKR